MCEQANQEFFSKQAVLYHALIDGEITREVYQRRLQEPTEQSEGGQIYDRLD